MYMPCRSFECMLVDLVFLGESLLADVNDQCQ